MNFDLTVYKVCGKKLVLCLVPHILNVSGFLKLHPVLDRWLYKSLPGAQLAHCSGLVELSFIAL